MRGALWFGVAWLLTGWSAASLLDWVRAPIWACLLVLLGLLALVALTVDRMSPRRTVLHVVVHTHEGLPRQNGDT